MRYLLLLTLFTFNSYAQLSIEDCEQAGESFGSQRAIPVKIPYGCKSLVSSSKDIYNWDKSDSLNIEVVGVKNLLYTKIGTKEHITSGEKSKLTNILAVKVNKDDQKTYVLNQKNNKFSIYSYFYASGGNTTPARKLVTEDIQNASNFRIDNQNKLLYVISNSESWVKVFNRDADPDGPRIGNSVSRLKIISGMNTLISSPIDISFSSTELFILDNDQILIFNISVNGDMAPSKIIAGDNTTISQAKYIEYDPSSSSIVIINGNGAKLKFDSNSNGNVSPK